MGGRRREPAFEALPRGPTIPQQQWDGLCCDACDVRTAAWCYGGETLAAKTLYRQNYETGRRAA
ncbi:hypothetical protein SPHINGO8AM_230031 [Sphingomonas sp. 8AM]|nr:hypothetical protein SPHINGO8AM_230031 [Sphingomonas sp. 8AM]